MQDGAADHSHRDRDLDQRFHAFPGGDDYLFLFACSRNKPGLNLLLESSNLLNLSFFSQHTSSLPLA